ncbi:protein OSB4, chloroplastic-like [Salvia miltiorrhiza]|uniref:protein OSB4, chloroplastic-like n=1 Tax=Salvia miltiorrhiza TaxID=226208 RepID=UPI0025AD5C95|nr:protein OSB4, chloroplastic-like [Salvia miltiorrhiza]
MNLLFRAKLSGRIRLSLSPLSSLQQSYSYATSKTPKPTSPKSQKSSTPSSSFSERIKKPTGDVIVWPKPSEIPYQAKVANFVKLIGYVNVPVQFDTLPGGKHYATTAISQEISDGRDPVLIAAVFEGDLAHVVASHVKVNDCVLVSGQLSSEPLLRFAKGDGFGRLHILGENLNFVEGFTRRVSSKKSEGSVFAVGIEKNVVEGVDDGKFEQQWEKALDDAKVKKFSGETNWGSGTVSVESNVGTKGAMPGSGEAKLEKGSVESGVKKKDGDRGLDLWRDLVKNSLLWWDYRDQKAKGLVKEKYPDFKHKETGDALWFNSAPQWVLQGIGKLEFDVPVVRAKFVQGGGQGYGERKVSGRDEEPKIVRGGGQGYGERKVSGRDEEPKIVRGGGQGYGERKVSGRDEEPKIVRGGGQGYGVRKGKGRDEDSWKDLVENPSKWWDNRKNKRNPKGPDFKHKETGKALWLSSSPEWALSRLPPSNDQNNCDATTVGAF